MPIKEITVNEIQPLILAGGKGTRLGEITKYTPKPILVVNNKIFIFYILEQIYRWGFKKTTISVGYKSDVIRKIIGNNYKSLKIYYSLEKSALGTGGAIKKFIQKEKKDYFLIMNGDSYTELNFNDFLNNYKKFMNIFFVGCKTTNGNRFGNVIVDKDMTVKEFKEKKQLSTGIINCGIYIVKKEVFKEERRDKLSFEKDILSFSEDKNFFCWPNADFLYDIGTKKSLKKSNEFFMKNVF